MNNKLIFTVIFCILLCAGCEKQNDNIVGLGFWNLPEYGNPVSAMENVIKVIESYDKNAQSYVSIKKIIPENSRFIFFSFTPDDYSYQLAWWSGETTWVYDSATKKYYETMEDLMHCNWYNISGCNIPLNVIKVNLYGK